MQKCGWLFVKTRMILLLLVFKLLCNTLPVISQDFAPLHWDLQIFTLLIFLRSTQKQRPIAERCTLI